MTGGASFARLALAYCAFVLVTCAAPRPASAELACPSVGRENVKLAGVEARLELRLEDGRLLRLAGLDPASATPSTPDREDLAREALKQTIVGHPLTITVLSGAPDRWGRLAVMAFSGDSTPGGVAAAAIAVGLGRYLADDAAHECRAVLIASEDSARVQKLGLWDDPYYAVLTAADNAGFTEKAGSLVVAEGRVASVETSPYRTKLIFAGERSGSHGGQILSATILPRTIKILEAHGVHVSSLSGQMLRIRGLLDLRFGPDIEILGPDDFDVIGPALGATPIAASGLK